MAASDNFIRKLTEAVAPILPITLRNKSLDGGYFRAALQLVAAAEFLFEQYEADVSIKANPAGVVGMCNNMHADIKRSDICNEELKPLGEFIKDMKTQYQTSLGLGASQGTRLSLGVDEARRRELTGGLSRTEAKISPEVGECINFWLEGEAREALTRKGSHLMTELAS